MKKKCKGCGKVKPMTDYYKGKGMKDGHLNKCKSCISSGVRANRRDNIEYYREYDRKRGNRQAKDYLKSYRDEYPNKYRAVNMVNNAIRDGRLKKETKCSECGALSPHAHHDDYAYPLSVRWLCAACHKQWHIKHGEGKNP